MSEFFKSAPVRAAMAEIQQLQEDIMTGLAINGMSHPQTQQEGLLHISKMRELLEKQKNFMFRLSLEKEDEDAIEMKEQILESARFLGLQPNQNIAEYFDSRSGQLITDGEQQDAKRLAIWYTGLAKQQIVSTELITEFSDDYPSVNRLLPVWRVSFDNGLRAYVDPSQSRLATLSNDQKMWIF